jgi:predicted MFS family arabinose efflux permease
MPARIPSIAMAGMVALAVAMGIGRFAFTPILPEMQHDDGLSLAAAGWLAASNYVGYLAGALAAVRLASGATRAVRGGLVAVSAATLAMGFTGNLAAWLALRFVAGAASACVLVFAAAWCLERFQSHATPREQSLRGATLFAGVGVGIAFAGIACNVLARAGGHAATAWIALGIAALAATGGVWHVFADSHAAAPKPEAMPASSWSAQRLRLVACYGAFGFGYIIPATFIAAMTRELEAAADPAARGWAWPLFGAAAAASTFAAAALRRHFADRSIWAASHLVMAAGVVTPLVWGGLAGYMVSALLVGGTFMVATMVGIQEARRVAGAEARALIAAMTAAFAVGQIAGPVFVAALAATGNRYDVPLATAAALLVASAVALLLRFPRETR